MSLIESLWIKLIFLVGFFGVDGFILKSLIMFMYSNGLEFYALTVFCFFKEVFDTVLSYRSKPLFVGMEPEVIESWSRLRLEVWILNPYSEIVF